MLVYKEIDAEISGINMTIVFYCSFQDRLEYAAFVWIGPIFEAGIL